MKKELEVEIYCPTCSIGEKVTVSLLDEMRLQSAVICTDCLDHSPFDQWCPDNISIPGAEGQEEKPLQKERLMERFLRGEWVDRFETIRDFICWELSARIGEMETEWGIKFIRNWIIRGGLRCRCYRLRFHDIEQIQDTLKNMRHNANTKGVK